MRPLACFVPTLAIPYHNESPSRDGGTVDATDSKSVVRKGVWVRIPLPVLRKPTRSCVRNLRHGSGTHARTGKTPLRFFGSSADGIGALGREGLLTGSPARDPPRPGRNHFRPTDTAPTSIVLRFCGSLLLSSAHVSTQRAGPPTPREGSRERAHSSRRSTVAPPLSQ